VKITYKTEFPRRTLVLEELRSSPTRK